MRVAGVVAMYALGHVAYLMHEAVAPREGGAQGTRARVLDRLFGCYQWAMGKSADLDVDEAWWKSPQLHAEIAAYERMQEKLEAEHFGEWALVHEEALIDTYPSFEIAADEALHRYGDGPYLIRQIGFPAVPRREGQEPTGGQTHDRAGWNSEAEA